MEKVEKIGKTEIVIYEDRGKKVTVEATLRNETIWLSLNQIASLFSTDKSGVSRHIKNIYASQELDRKSTVAKIATVQKEGVREIERNIEFYSLDTILSVGYRVNSRQATQFRIWATKVLREHITRGYTINRARIARNYEAFMKSVADIQKLLPEHIILDPKAVLDLIKEFASTWMSLDAYDKSSLKVTGSTKKSIRFTGIELRDAIANLRKELLRKGEATGIFAQERAKESIEGIVGNVMQSFGGKPVYPTIEEKAANLLYFMVKNHPFTDGNKRSGAFSFMWFLRRARIKGGRNINPAGLTALTLLIAESDSKKKGQMVALVTQLLKK
jgi:prophage maintenance system killer protein